MPQFDPTPFVGQLFWLALCFIILLFTMTKWLIPRLRQGINHRNHYLLEYKQKTATLLDHAAQLNQEIHHHLFVAQQEVKVFLQHGIRDMEAQQRSELLNQDHQLNKKIASYEKALAKEANKARKDLKRMAPEITERFRKHFFLLKENNDHDIS